MSPDKPRQLDLPIPHELVLRLPEPVLQQCQQLLSQLLLDLVEKEHVDREDDDE
ncbi:MAG: hypothetical protein GXY55_03400 [Phycisphaerae bacterium]|nr:hypothetical protein [Phycisphaerae bacterium]